MKFFSVVRLVTSAATAHKEEVTSPASEEQPTSLATLAVTLATSLVIALKVPSATTAV